jgi:hypothetical protein
VGVRDVVGAASYGCGALCPVQRLVVERRLPPGRRPVRAVALVLTALLVVTACATSTPMISEEERCTRFGGLWQQDGWCRHDGGAGAM